MHAGSGGRSRLGLRAAGRAALVALTGIALVSACGGAPPPPPPPPGDIAGAPSLASLPLPEAELTPLLGEACALASSAFALASPTPPAETASFSEVQAYMSGPLAAWSEEKRGHIERARELLDNRATQGGEARVAAAAMLALLYEDLARGQLAVPVPQAFVESDPEAAGVFRYVVESAAQSSLDLARRAYQACTSHAQAVDALHGWARFCSERRARLPLTQRDMHAGGGTVVDVVVE